MTFSEWGVIFLPPQTRGRMKKLYIAGPMSGLEGHNYEAFHRAELVLEKDYIVFNPASNFNGDRTKPYHEYMRADIQMVMDADELCFLPGWEKSKGALFEYSVAQMLGLECWELIEDYMSPYGIESSYVKLPILPEPATPSPRPNTREGSIAIEAAGLVIDGERQADYGHPYYNMKQTGEMWGSILNQGPIAPKLVALMMIAAKISRETHKPKRDNLVDMAGYAEVAHIVSAKEAELNELT